jgi:hypothetical protein
MNPLYNQLNGGNINPMFSRIKQFKDTFSGDPKQMVQQMLNSGKVSQAQMNQYIQQANEIYKMMK